MTAPTATRHLAGAPTLLLLLVVSLLSTLLVARPAGAQDLVTPTEDPTPPVHGADDLAQPEAPPSLKVTDDCDPDGFHYEMTHPDAPPNAVYALQYREAPNGPIQALPIGPASGFVPSGEGTFLVRGAIVVQGQLLHQYDWVEVTVFCPGLVPVPEGPTEVEIDLTPVCDPTPGIEYAITISNAPDGPLAHKAQWRELGGGPVTTVDGQAGTLTTGEGTFEVRGVVHAQGRASTPATGPRRPWTAPTRAATTTPTPRTSPRTTRRTSPTTRSRWTPTTSRVPARRPSPADRAATRGAAARSHPGAGRSPWSGALAVGRPLAVGGA